MSINSCSCKTKSINLIVILIIFSEINAEISFYLWLISKYSTRLRFFEAIYKVEVVNWSLLQSTICTSDVIQLKVVSPSGSLLINLAHIHPRSQGYSGIRGKAGLENTTWVRNCYSLPTVFLISYGYLILISYRSGQIIGNSIPIYYTVY